MNEPVLDPIRHNSWATKRLIRFCRDLTAEQLHASAPGAYGSIISTIAHLLSAEGRYGYLLAGAQPKWGTDPSETPGLDDLESRAEEMEGFWQEFLASPFDPERTFTRTRSDGSVWEAQAGVIVAQLINHGNEHRGQVCTILTTLGIEAPSLDGWTYGVDTGRAVELT